MKDTASILLYKTAIVGALTGAADPGKALGAPATLASHASAICLTVV